MTIQISPLNKSIKNKSGVAAEMKLYSPVDFGFDLKRISCLTKIVHRYVDEGKSAGIITLLARRGAVVHLEKYGYQNLEKKKPIAFDTLFRIYSMTKPITSVAFMMLYEEGLIRLEDPVHKYIPEFKSMEVVEAGGKLVAPNQDVKIIHLLTHTAGLSYGDQKDSLVDKLYVRANLEEEGTSNEEFVRRITDLPLRFHPGENWHYSYATDVIGYLVELLSGVSLSEFMKEKIFIPLGMVDTFFRVPETSKHRLSELYGYTEDKFLQVIDNSIGGNFYEIRRDSGGAGLVSTITDYFRFAQCMLNRGELDEARLLGPKTVELMRVNHLPASMLPIVMEEPWPGIGFGLGFSVVIDITQSDQRGSIGSHGWGGWASTHFWIDPIEEIIGILMLQYIPSRTFPLTNDFRNAVYQALIE
jgi:CubicO group peptidase (beta-lactamase class C family)